MGLSLPDLPVTAEPAAYLTSDLLALVRTFTDHPDRRLGLSRHLAAVLLLRQALEAALDDVWAVRAPGLGGCSSRAQLVSLPFFLDDQDLAGEVVYTWHRLSRACHHDEYDLPPAGEEVRHLTATVERLAASVRPT